MDPNDNMGWIPSFITSRDGEGRGERLWGLALFVKGRLGMTDGELFSRLETLEDHKGDLTVSWRIVPTAAEREAFNAGWTNMGEPAENVHHHAPIGPHDKD